MELSAGGTAIVYDSTADLPDGPARHDNWWMVPLTVHLGDRTFRDHVDLAPDEFYRLLAAGRTAATTSQPSPDAFARAYGEALGRYEHVLSLHISGRLSGTVESARLAAAEHPGRVTVVDTGAVAVMLALAVEGAQRFVERGATLADVAAYLDRFRSSAGILFSVDTLEYLQRGGRIGKAQAFLGGLLSVRPILAVGGGEVRPVRRVRGAHRMLGALLEELERQAPPGPLRIAVAHAAAPEAGRELLAAVRAARPDAEVNPLATIGPVVGAHAGPGTLGLAFASEPLP